MKVLLHIPNTYENISFLKSFLKNKKFLSFEKSLFCGHFLHNSLRHIYSQWKISLKSYLLNNIKLMEARIIYRLSKFIVNMIDNLFYKVFDTSYWICIASNHLICIIFNDFLSRILYCCNVEYHHYEAFITLQNFFY